MRHIVEIRSYNLKPGTRAAFHSLFLEQSLPLLRRWKIDVVAYGGSLHDHDSYYLIRAYASLEVRQRSQNAFYGSAEWLNGPRQALVILIDSFTSVVIEMDDDALRGLRNMLMP